MSALIYPVFSFLVILYCLRAEPGAILAMLVFAALGALGLYVGADVTGTPLLALAVGTASCGLPALRQRWLSPRLFAFFKRVAPRVSETERTALEAGTVGWEGDLFSGRPDWRGLLNKRNPGLSEREQAFLDEQCETVCGMCNGWDIAVERADLPAEAWEYLKKEKFFGMIIPEEYGGLGLSAKAQSMVLQKLSVNETLMVVVGVPNSLGPGELLLKYGTDAQKNHYLPRLADGRELPCFGLTGPRAGSDATSIPDTGIVCKGEFNGEQVLGVRLNFEKRWITLAPIATVVGLAFRLFDPEHLLGETEDIGITCALVPRDTEGMEIGPATFPSAVPS
jgi:acyl-CoA dehydrogenase